MNGLTKTQWAVLGALGTAVVLVFCCLIAAALALSTPRGSPPAVAQDYVPPAVETQPAPTPRPAQRPSPIPPSPTAAPTRTIEPSPTIALTPTPTSYKVGETVSKGNWEYTVTKVEKTNSFVWSSFGNKSTAQGTFLIVSLTLKNTGNHNFSINTWDFELRDPAGVSYDVSTETYTWVTYKKLTSLGDQFVPGMSVQTALVFDINPSATQMKLWLGQAEVAVDVLP